MPSFEIDAKVDVPGSKTPVTIKTLLIALPVLLVSSFVFYSLATVFTHAGPDSQDSTTALSAEGLQV